MEASIRRQDSTDTNRRGTSHPNLKSRPKELPLEEPSDKHRVRPHYPEHGRRTRKDINASFNNIPVPKSQDGLATEYHESCPDCRTPQGRPQLGIFHARQRSALRGAEIGRAHV